MTVPPVTFALSIMLNPLPTGFLLSLALSLGLGSALASGTYPPAPPRLRSDITAEIDPATYNLGKLIFAGKAKLAGTAVAPAQARETRNVLEDLVDRIPERAREQLKVETLAQELNAAETAALLYYLRLRFRLAEVTV